MTAGRVVGRHVDKAWSSREAARAKFIARWGDEVWNRSTLAVFAVYAQIPVGPEFGVTVELLRVLDRIAPLVSELEHLLAVPAATHIAAPERPGAEKITTKVLRERCAAVAGAFAPARAAGEVLSPIVRSPDGRRRARLRPETARVHIIDALLSVTPGLMNRPAYIVCFAIGWGLERAHTQPPEGASKATRAAAAGARARVLDRWKNALRRWREAHPHSRVVKTAA